MTITRQALVNAFLSKQIAANVASGMEVPAAFDAVMGEGAYMKLASTVYHELRARQGL